MLEFQNLEGRGCLNQRMCGVIHSALSKSIEVRCGDIVGVRLGEGLWDCLGWNFRRAAN